MPYNTEISKNILIVGDLHIDNRKSSIKNSEAFDEIFRLFNLIEYEVIERKPEFIVFLGDIFDSPDNISTNVISIVSMLFKNLSELTKVVIITGNHDSVDDGLQTIDMTDGKSERLRSSLVYPFSMNDEILIIDSPNVTDMSVFGLKMCISFMPYQIDMISHLKSIQDKLIDGYKHVMFGHFDIRDLNYVKLVKDASMVEKVPSSEELFNEYNQDLVILGHVHERMEYLSDDGAKKVVFVGSARNINYNNKEEEKGIYSLNLESLELEYIPNENTAIYKVFRTTDELDNYLMESSDEKLAKTKVKFIYSDAKDTIRYNPYKKKLRRLEFEKSIFTASDGTQINSNVNLDDLKMENIMNCENLFKFILDFKNVANEDRQEYLDFMLRFAGDATESTK